MAEPLYALVAYIKNSLGKWVEDLRTEVHPLHDHSPAHITVLPPRCLQGSEQEALDQIEVVCRNAQPFNVVLGEIQNFMPLTPTVFIRVERAAYRLRELHDQLNKQALFYEEPWPFMPHLTIAKFDSMEQACAAAALATERWAAFSGSREAPILELTFVRQKDHSTEWIDLAPVHLGQPLTSTSK